MINFKDLPIPRGHFISGNLRDFNHPQRHLIFERWIEEHGDLFRIRLLNKHLIVCANPLMIDAILSRRPDSFSRFPKIDEVLIEMGVEGVFSAEGAAWKQQRKVVSEALSLKKTKGFYPRIIEKSAALVSRWETYSKTRQSIDVLEEMRSFTLEVTCSLIFGYEMNNIRERDEALAQHLDLIFPMVNQRITAAFPLWRLLAGKKDKDLKVSLVFLKKLVDDLIDKAKYRLRETPHLREQPSNFLEAMLVEKEKEVFSEEQLFSNVFTMLMAGQDTSSNTLSWLIYFLAQSPEIAAAVGDESRMVFGEAPIQSSDDLLKKLPLAAACIEETVRLKSTAPILYIQALHEVDIEGLSIPKGAGVLLQTRFSQLSENHFSDGTVFNPYRWIKGACPYLENHSPDRIRSFGFGPRYCPGKNLAYAEMIILIADICRTYEFELEGDALAVQEVFNFTMQPDNLKIKLRRQ